MWASSTRCYPFSYSFANRATSGFVYSEILICQENKKSMASVKVESKIARGRVTVSKQPNFLKFRYYKLLLLRIPFMRYVIWPTLCVTSCLLVYHITCSVHSPVNTRTGSMAEMLNNTVVPPYSLIKYPQFQLSAVKRGLCHRTHAKTSQSFTFTRAKARERKYTVNVQCSAQYTLLLLHFILVMSYCA
jgi:hypothetical protein